MGLGTQMNENERGVFALHGLTGGLIATALLLAILAGLTVFGIASQKANAENYYMINQDLNAIKAASIFESGDQVDGSKNYTMRKDGLAVDSQNPFK
jgi:uncharacterized iron-regulated membrane protein